MADPRTSTLRALPDEEEQVVWNCALHSLVMLKTVSARVGTLGILRRSQARIPWLLLGIWRGFELVGVCEGEK